MSSRWPLISNPPIAKYTPHWRQTEGPRRVLGQEPLYPTDPPLKVTDGVTILIHEEERWKATACAGLSKAQWNDDQKQVSPASDQRASRPPQGIQNIHEVGRTMGIQQYPNQRGRRVESSILNELRTVQADSHVLQVNKFTRDVPVDNGPHLPRPHQHQEGLCLHQQHRNPYQNTWRTPTHHKGGFRDPPNKQTLHQTGEVWNREGKDRVPGSGSIQRESRDGSRQNRGPDRLADTKEVQSFLGFYNFYRRFIKDYSKITKPLNQLTGKEEWKWGAEQQTAFDTLWRVITEWPVLAIPVDDKPYRVEADSSDFALGAVLSQWQNDKWHHIAYLSKLLTEAKWN